MPFKEAPPDHEQWWLIEKWCVDKQRKVKPEVVLRQVAPERFQLVRGFRYELPARDRPGGNRRAAWNIPANRLGDPPTGENFTDLASVPSWLWWFIASYGRHSRAALLHDYLIADDRTKDRTADHAFRVALRESEVPILRRWLMWNAVSLASLLRQFGMPKIPKRLAQVLGKVLVAVFALYVIAFAAAFTYALYSSWGSIEGVLAWPFVNLWDLTARLGVPGWIDSAAGSVWSWLDAVPLLEGTPWRKVVFLFVVGSAAWRLRWPITLVGLAVVTVPSLAVFGARILARLLELALWCVSCLLSLVPGVDVDVVRPRGRRAPFEHQVGLH